MAGQFVIKQIAQEVISEVNQPLYIGGKLADGSDAKITVASNGDVSTATPLTVPSLTVNSKPVMSSLLASYTVTGSAVTSIDFSGLDINTHKSYRVELSLENPTASPAAMYVYVNNDSVIANYYNQYLHASNTTVSGLRGNAPEFSYISATQKIFCVVNVQLVNGYAKFGSSSYRYDSGVDLTVYATSKTTTVTNITQLTFTALVANAIGVGSTIRIYRSDV